MKARLSPVDVGGHQVADCASRRRLKVTIAFEAPRQYQSLVNMVSRKRKDFPQLPSQVVAVDKYALRECFALDEPAVAG